MWIRNTVAFASSKFKITTLGLVAISNNILSYRTIFENCTVRLHLCPLICCLHGLYDSLSKCVKAVILLCYAHYSLLAFSVVLRLRLVQHRSRIIKSTSNSLLLVNLVWPEAPNLRGSIVRKVYALRRLGNALYFGTCSHQKILSEALGLETQSGGRHHRRASD